MTTSAREVTLLVVAKAPVPGLAKTRLMASLTPDDAADVAAAALLDTLAAAQASPFARVVVALTGDVSAAARAAEISAALSRVEVIDQRGDGFAERLVHAHRDAAGRGPVIQVGMDTPQVTAALLAEVHSILNGHSGLAGHDGHDAVLGPAEDGGWWVLGLRDASHARALVGIAMSTPETGAATRDALTARGLSVGTAPVLRDVDEPTDLGVVAALCSPSSAFARAVAALPSS